MKKLLLILAAILTMGTAAHAQLTVKGETKKLNKIASVRTGLVTLYNYGDLFLVSLPTTNRFDENMTIYLGDTKESALQSLLDLMRLSGTIEKGKMIIIDNRGKDCRLSRGDLGAVIVNMDGFAGYGSYTRTEMGTLWEKLRAHKVKEESE